MVNKLFEYIGEKIKNTNLWIDTYSVNCIELPAQDGIKRIVNFEEKEKVDFIFSDTQGTSFYIKFNPKLIYQESRRVSSCDTEYLTNITFRLVLYSINKELEFTKFEIENILQTNLKNIPFSDYTGLEKQIKITLINSNLEGSQVFKEEFGKDYDFGAELTAIYFDCRLSFISMNEFCINDCINTI